MSQTKNFAVSSGTTVRVHRTTGAKAGAGLSKHWYVGRDGNYDYDSYVKFTLNWTDVGSIVSATLVIWSDDGSGESDLSTTDVPTVNVRRLTDAFANGTHTTFSSLDWTTAAGTTSGSKTVTTARAANALNRIDVTAIVRAWAPAAVTGGGKLANYGIGLYGNTDKTKNWATWSDQAVDAAVRPYIELVYEYGPTTPNTPTGLVPSGAVGTITTFGADFSDLRTTDRLVSSEVQVFSPPHSGTVAVSDFITSVNHGLNNGTLVWLTSLSGGAGLSQFVPYYVRQKTASTFKVATTNADATIVNVTTTGTLTWVTSVYDVTLPCSNTEATNGRSLHTPTSAFSIPSNVDHQWRVRQTDQEGMTSPWTAFTTFSYTNVNPGNPTTEPASGSFATLDGVRFRMTNYTDSDGDALDSYQMQLSAYPSGNPNWDDPLFVLWDTSRTYLTYGSTAVDVPYGGASLAAGTYYWRARWWDNREGVSAWVYHSFTLTADFVAEPAQTTSIQLRPRAPWRIVIKEMKFNAVGGALSGVAATNVLSTASPHGFAAGRKVRFLSLTGGSGLLLGTDYYVIASGLTTTAFKVSLTSGGTEVDFTTTITSGTVTAITTRGPGNIVAILENAKSLGASIVYNSPGEMHFTLPVDDPQISVIEPKQTHYSVQFYSGDGWREVFAGLMWDYDATERDIVFYGIDYLALYDYILDERYDASNINKPSEKGGSKYVTAGKNSISYIVGDQLQRAKDLPNSPVGFISVGTIDTMSETVVVFSTYQPCLTFCTGLIDSHRGAVATPTLGKRSRIQVRRKTDGSYEVVVKDSPGIVRDNMRLKYGELVQGFRVIPFGQDWASRTSSIGRPKDGIQVLYETMTAPGIDEAVWGRFTQAQVVDGVIDSNDLKRRTQQTATKSGKLGKQVGLGLRSGLIQPLDGYDITDIFPVSIKHGPVDTSKWGSGYWACMAVTWEASDQGQQTVTLTLQPREDTTPPSADLLSLSVISPQAEWQIGWQPPNPLTATSKYWLDQNTGIVYRRDEATGALHAVTAIA